jgi:hypothetical protein
MDTENHNNEETNTVVAPLPTVNECSLRDDTVWYRIYTSVDGDEASRLDSAGRQFIEREKAHLVMIDLTHAKQFSLSAQHIWVDFLRNTKIQRTAIYGVSMLSRVIATLIITASKKENVKMFEHETEAYEWLRGAV